MSPSGLVIMRLVKPVPAERVKLLTILALKRRSVGLVVVTDPLLLVVAVPAAPTATSTGFARSAPVYSRMRMSGKGAAAENCTVTMLEAADAATMFFA